MRSEELQSTVETSAKGLWMAWFYDQSFQDQLNAVLRIVPSDIVVESEGEWPNLIIRRQLVFDTDRDIPKPLLKIVRGATRVRESAVLDAAARTMTVALRVPVISNRVDYGYQYRWSEGDGGPLQMSWRGHCDVRIPIIRGLAESYLMGELHSATRDGAAFCQRWFGGAAR